MQWPSLVEVLSAPGLYLWSSFFTGPNQNPGTLLGDIAAEGAKAGATPDQVVAWQAEAAGAYLQQTGSPLPQQAGTENLPPDLRPSGFDWPPIYWILGAGTAAIVGVELIRR